MGVGMRVGSDAPVSGASGRFSDGCRVLRMLSCGEGLLIWTGRCLKAVGRLERMHIFLLCDQRKTHEYFNKDRIYFSLHYFKVK